MKKILFKVIDKTDYGNEVMTETTNYQEALDAFEKLFDEWLWAGYTPRIELVACEIEV